METTRVDAVPSVFTKTVTIELALGADDTSDPDEEHAILVDLNCEIAAVHAYRCVLTELISLLADLQEELPGTLTLRVGPTQRVSSERPA